MTMDDVDTFPQSDGSQVWKERKEVGQGGRRSYCRKRYVVHLETGGQPSYSHSVWGVAMGDHYDLCRNDENAISRAKVISPYGTYA